MKRQISLWQKILEAFSVKKAVKHDSDKKIQEAAEYVSRHFGRAIERLAER